MHYEPIHIDMQKRTAGYRRLMEKARRLVDTADNDLRQAARLIAYARVCGTYLHLAAYAQLRQPHDADTGQMIVDFSENMLNTVDYLMEYAAAPKHAKSKTKTKQIQPTRSVRLMIFCDGLNSIAALLPNVGRDQGYNMLWHDCHNDLCLRDRAAAHKLTEGLTEYLTEACLQQARSRPDLVAALKVIGSRAQLMRAKLDQTLQ